MKKFHERLTPAELSLIKDESKSVKEIASVFGVHPMTITRAIAALNIPRKTGRKKGEVRVEKVGRTCKSCGNTFQVLPSSPKVYCKRSCVSSCPDYRKKLANMDKSYMQTERYKQTLRKEDTPKYSRYRNMVHKASQKVYEQNIDYINPNGYNRALCGSDGGWQLDHIIPVRVGFDNDIPPEVLSIKENLRMVTWRENLARNKSENYDEYIKAIEKARVLIEGGFYNIDDDNDESILKLAAKILIERE